MIVMHHNDLDGKCAAAIEVVATLEVLGLLLKNCHLKENKFSKVGYNKT